MQRADVFLYYDTAQFVKRTWHSRTYISYNGQARLISLPIETAQNGSRRPLNLMRLADHIPWRKDMARCLKERYAQAKDYTLLGEVIDLVQHGPTTLSEWN